MKNLIYYPLGTILILSSISHTARSENGGFTIVNGQIFTPGLAILDSPQPFTPLGGGEFSSRYIWIYIYIYIYKHAHAHILRILYYIIL